MRDINVELFVEDEKSYMNWLTKNDYGVVLNVRQGKKGAIWYACMHTAKCRHMTKLIKTGHYHTAPPYRKACGKTEALVNRWYEITYSAAPAIKKCSACFWQSTVRQSKKR